MKEIKLNWLLSNGLIVVFFIIQGHRELFTDEILSPFLDGATVKTDEQRIQEVSSTGLEVISHYILCFNIHVSLFITHQISRFNIYTKL